MNLPITPDAHDWARFEKRQRTDYATRALLWTVALVVILEVVRRAIFATITHFTGFPL